MKKESNKSHWQINTYIKTPSSPKVKREWQQLQSRLIMMVSVNNRISNTTCHYFIPSPCATVIQIIHLLSKITSTMSNHHLFVAFPCIVEHAINRWLLDGGVHSYRHLIIQIMHVFLSPLQFISICSNFNLQNVRSVEVLLVISKDAVCPPITQQKKVTIISMQEENF